MGSIRKPLTHEQRLAKWGPAPDRLFLDKHVCLILQHCGCDPEAVIEEICWKRRHMGKYDYCSIRTLSIEETRHVVLETIPFEAPPIRLQIGKSKNARIIVERTLPGSNYQVEYESTESRASYFVRSAPMPQAVVTGMTGKAVSEVIKGMPDSRIIKRVNHLKFKGNEGFCLSVDAVQQEFRVSPVDHRMSISFVDGPVKFADGRRMTLEDALLTEPDSRGAKIYDRNAMDFTALTIDRQGHRDDYIAIQPVWSSKRPKLELDGGYRALPFDCYLVRADRAHPEQLSACASRSTQVRINDPAFRDEITSTITRP